jgi:hypothetical protein
VGIEVGIAEFSILDRDLGARGAAEGLKRRMHRTPTFANMHPRVINQIDIFARQTIILHSLRAARMQRMRGGSFH